MSDKISPNNAYSKEWEWFQQNNNLTDSQIEKFKTYYNLLFEWNDKINITRIIELDDVLNYHFADSLVLSNYVDLTKFNSIADVGTGGGFPGIPLKIKYPQITDYTIFGHQEVGKTLCPGKNLQKWIKEYRQISLLQKLINELKSKIEAFLKGRGR